MDYIEDKSYLLTYLVNHKQRTIMAEAAFQKVEDQHRRCSELDKWDLNQHFQDIKSAAQEFKALLSKTEDGAERKAIGERVAQLRSFYDHAWSVRANRRLSWEYDWPRDLELSDSNDSKNDSPQTIN